MRCFNSQFVIGSRVGDSALGREQAQPTGRLRRDLGIVIDALRVVCAAVPQDHLSATDRLAFQRLAELGGGSVPVGVSDAVNAGAVDNFIDALRQLRQDDPGKAGAIIRRILEEAGPPPTRSISG